MMKKFLTSCFVALTLVGQAMAAGHIITMTTTLSVGSQVTLRVASIDKYTIDFGDGQVQTYPASTREVTGEVKGATLVVSGSSFLTGLDCSGLQLTALSINAPSLASLNCSDNQLTKLDLSKATGLEALDCSKNQLTALTANKLTGMRAFDCSDNQISAINVNYMPQLTYFNCANNQLTTLSVLKNEALQTLNCAGNQLGSLTLTRNPELLLVNCSDNKIATLSATTNEKLTDLFCQNNALSVLKMEKVAKLNVLNCANNRLTTLSLPTVTSTNKAYALNYGYNNLDMSSMIGSKAATTHIYYPQDTIVLDFTSVNVGEYIDWADYLKSSSGIVVGTVSYRNALTGEALKKGSTEGCDYNNVQTRSRFLRGIPSVYAVLSSTTYPLLTIPTSTFTVIDPTGINTVGAADRADEGTTYDLQGRKTGAQTKGIVIKNGKKVINK